MLNAKEKLDFYGQKNNTILDDFIVSCYTYEEVYSARRDSDLSEDFIIPGTGKKPRNCVGLQPKKFCPGCAHIQFVRGNCNKPSCPDCFNDWRYKRLKKGFSRLFSFKRHYTVRIGHFVISVKPEDIYRVTVEGVEWLRKKIRNVAKQKGVYGGVEVFHPFRVKKKCKPFLFQKANKHFDYDLGDYGLWKILVKLYRKGIIDDWRDFVYFSPHFHILGAFKWVQPALEGERFVFKRVGDLSNAEDIVKSYMYLLSHLGIDTTKVTHQIRWFGKLSNSNWSLKRSSKRVRKQTLFLRDKLIGDFKHKEDYGLCPKCQSEMLDMNRVLDVLNRFSSEDRKKLKFCYQWAKGLIPPPSKLKLDKMGILGDNR